MADRYSVTGEGQLKRKPRATITGYGGASLSRPQGPYSRESNQLLGIMVLLVSTGILLFLSGITLTTAIISFVCFATVIIITSPIWIPSTIFLFFVVAGVLSLCALGLGAAAVVSLLSRYL